MCEICLGVLSDPDGCCDIDIDANYYNYGNDFEFFEDNSPYWRGFYCGNDKWIVPEWANEPKNMLKIHKILCSDLSEENMFWALIEFFLERGIDLTKNVQVKDYGKSARSIV